MYNSYLHLNCFLDAVFYPNLGKTLKCTAGRLVEETADLYYLGVPSVGFKITLIKTQ
jgi:hypothetical protein